MDITPLIPKGQQAIESYGNNRFSISGVTWYGGVIILPNRTMAWSAQSYESLSKLHFEEILAAFKKEEFPPEVILLGSGRALHCPLPVSLGRLLPFFPDAMQTASACHSYNVLLAEGRRVMAVLLPVIEEAS